MAISVRDIQEKEFGTQATGGYNIEQVDDFLDEIIQQMQQMEQERKELTDTIDYLASELKRAGIVPANRDLEYVAEPVSPHAAFAQEGSKDE